MPTTIQLPEDLATRLENLAKEEGTSLDTLIDRLVAEHVERRPRPVRERKTVQLPLLSKEEAPVVRSLTGAEIDEIFADEDLKDFTSGR